MSAGRLLEVARLDLARHLRRPMLWILVALVALHAALQPAWPAEIFDAGLGYRLDHVLVRNQRQIEEKLLRSPSRLLSLREGINSTISVRQMRTGISLLINGVGL